MRFVYTLAVIVLAASAIALPVWEAQARDDVTEYYHTGNNGKRDGETIDLYHICDNGKKREIEC